MHRSGVRNAPKLRKGAKLGNLNPKVDGVKGSIAPLAGCRGRAPAGVKGQSPLRGAGAEPLSDRQVASTALNALSVQESRRVRPFAAAA